MGNLNEIEIPGDADDALVWAIGRESELRDERYRVARLGLAGAIEKLVPTFRRMTEAITGLDRVTT